MHYHIDHVQALAGFIRNTKQQADFPITLYIHRGLALEFVGWFAENYPHLMRDSAPLFQLRLIDSQPVQVGSSKVQALLTNTFTNKSLSHFITCATYVFKEAGKCVKTFSGDTNPPSPRPSFD